MLRFIVDFLKEFGKKNWASLLANLIVIIGGLLYPSFIARWISGLTFSLIFAHLIISKFMAYLRVHINELNGTGDPDISLYRHDTLNGWIGIIERLFYTVAIVARGRLVYFIPIWLGLKVIGRFTEGGFPHFTPLETDPEKVTKEERELNLRKNSKAATTVINLFLLGTLLSLIFAALGAWIISGGDMFSWLNISRRYF